MNTTKSLFTMSAAIFALVAAYLWFKSSVVNVEPALPNPDGMTDAQITVTEGQKKSDFIPTAREQTRWSKRAATAACVSAISQAVALFLP